ncbi:metal-dependent hydrolase [Lachnotalea glycerini]|nr:metal-dependent hydrolase [Lachnotalea glycerini]
MSLNSKLIEAPRNCIEYVVLHEFTHFIHPNHSKKFYDFVAMLMPDWKERKMELEKRL